MNSLLQDLDIDLLHINLLVEFDWEFGRFQQLRIHGARHDRWFTRR